MDIPVLNPIVKLCLCPNNNILLSVRCYPGKMRKCDSRNEAEDFENEYKECLVNQQQFTSRKKMDEYFRAGMEATKSHTTPTKNGNDVKNVAIDDMSPEDKAKYNKIQTLMEEARPQPEFKLYWLTTKNSPTVAVLFRPVNDRGEPQWFMKPPFDAVVQAFFTACPSSTNAVNQFFVNLKQADQRDPNQGPNDVMMSKPKKEGAPTFKQYVLWTTFELPVDTLTSAEEEEDYIELTLKHAINDLRQAQRNPLFMATVESAYSESFYKAMMSPKAYGGTFVTYIQKARTTVERCDNLNKHVILDASKEIKMKVFQNDQPEKKYPTDSLYRDQKEIKERASKRARSDNDNSGDANA